MIYRFLLIIAIIIFTLNLYVGPRFFNIESDNTGTFVGVIMLAIIINHLLKDKDSN